MSRIFYHIFSNLLSVFSGRKFFLHVLAIVSTYILVISGFDWFYFVSSQTYFLKVTLFPAIVLGGILPIIVPLVLYAVGEFISNRKISITGLALGQAVILGSFISSLYKAFTGRLEPNLLNTINDISHQFNFGFWENGIFWGWPSSHTTIAFAMAFAIMSIYRKNKVVLYSSLIYALYIGIGVSASIHWFSDFLAGMIIGSVIGLVVGDSFKNLLSSKEVLVT